MKIFNTALKALMTVFCLFSLKFTLADQMEDTLANQMDTLANQMEDLFRVYNGDINKVNTALKQKADPNHENSYGETASVEAAEDLFRGIYNEDINKVNTALKQKEDPNLENSYGETASVEAAEDLFRGIYNRDINKVNTALKQGADPNLENSYGETALVEAAKAGFYDIVKALLEAGADPNILNSESEAALIEAANENHTNIVKLLLAHKADPDIGANSWFANTNFGRFIIFYAPGIDETSGDTALMTAAGNLNLSAVIALLEAGADPNIQNEFGNTTLIRVTRMRYWDSFLPVSLSIIKALLKAGADPNIQNDFGETAYTVAKSPKIKNILFEK